MLKQLFMTALGVILAMAIINLLPAGIQRFVK